MLKDCFGVFFVELFGLRSPALGSPMFSSVNHNIRSVFYPWSSPVSASQACTAAVAGGFQETSVRFLVWILMWELSFSSWRHLMTDCNKCREGQIEIFYTLRMWSALCAWLTHTPTLRPKSRRSAHLPVYPPERLTLPLILLSVSLITCSTASLRGEEEEKTLTAAAPSPISTSRCFLFGSVFERGHFPPHSCSCLRFKPTLGLKSRLINWQVAPTEGQMETDSLTLWTGLASRYHLLLTLLNINKTARHSKPCSKILILPYRRWKLCYFLIQQVVFLAYL